MKFNIMDIKRKHYNGGKFVKKNVNDKGSISKLNKKWMHIYQANILILFDNLTKMMNREFSWGEPEIRYYHIKEDKASNAMKWIEIKMS